MKAFNNIYVEHLATLHRPAGDPERSVLAIAGDDPAAKNSVAEFLDSIGYDAFDVGPLAEGWRFQRDTAAYVQPYALPGTTYPTWTARPVSAAILEPDFRQPSATATCEATRSAMVVRPQGLEDATG